MATAIWLRMSAGSSSMIDAAVSASTNDSTTAQVIGSSELSERAITWVSTRDTHENGGSMIFRSMPSTMLPALSGAASSSRLRALPSPPLTTVLRASHTLPNSSTTPLAASLGRLPRDAISVAISAMTSSSRWPRTFAACSGRSDRTRSAALRAPGMFSCFARFTGTLPRDPRPTSSTVQRSRLAAPVRRGRGARRAAGGATRQMPCRR